MLVGIIRMVLWKSGQWNREAKKLAKVEEQIFGGDCADGCMYK